MDKIGDYVISEKIIALLNAENKKLIDFYNSCDVATTTLKKIIYKKVKSQNVSVGTLLKIAKSLGVSPGYLTGTIEYSQDLKVLLTNYLNSSNHGKAFIQEMAKHEAKLTEFENSQEYTRKIMCIEPTGDFQNGILWDTCKIDYVTTYLPEVCFAFRIPSHAFATAYSIGDELLLEHRFPKVGENAIFYKGNRVYVRRFNYISKTKTYILEAITINAKTITTQKITDYDLIGTIISPKRTTNKKFSKYIEDVPLPLNIQKLVDKIKEPQ